MAINIQDLPIGLILKNKTAVDSSTTGQTVTFYWEDSVGPYKQVDDDSANDVLQTELPMSGYGVNPSSGNRESFYLTAGALPSGKTRADKEINYTLTRRGILSGNVANPPTASDADSRNYKAHPRDSVFTIDETWLVKKLKDDFVAGASQDTTIVANGAVNEGYVVYVDSNGKAVEGVSSGKFYGVSETTVADTEACTITLPGNIATVTTPGTNGDYVYATSAGVLTATATGNTLVGIKLSSSTMVVLQPSEVAELSQAQAEDNTSTVFGTVSGQRIGQAIDKNFSIQATARESLSVGDVVVMIKDNAFADAVTQVGFGNATSTEKKAFPIYGNGTSMSSMKGAFKKTGSPGDNLVVRIETDSSGVPSGTLADANATCSIAGSGLTTSFTDETVTFAGSFTLTDNTKYWLVYERSGAVDVSNYYGYGYVSQISEPVATYNTSWSVNVASTGSVYIGSPTGIYQSGVVKSILPSSVSHTAHPPVWLGVVKEDCTAGSTAVVVRSGIVGGLTGLSAGYPYQTDGETLSVSTNGVNNIIGIAASSTEFYVDISST